MTNWHLSASVPGLILELTAVIIFPANHWILIQICKTFRPVKKSGTMRVCNFSKAMLLVEGMAELRTQVSLRPQTWCLLCWLAPSQWKTLWGLYFFRKCTLEALWRVNVSWWEIGIIKSCCIHTVIVKKWGKSTGAAYWSVSVLHC